MERTDAVVALVGAVIVAVAVVGASLRGAAGGSSFSVEFSTSDLLVGEGNRQHQAENVRDSFAFTVTEANATRLNVTVFVTFVGGPGAQAAMDALLTAPNGTTFEAQGATRAPSLGGTQAVASLSFDVPLGAAPANRTVDAASREDAVRLATPEANASWVGEWTLDVSAQAGPTPLAQATTAWSATLTEWRGVAIPSPAAAR